MIRKLLAATALSASLVTATPALAAPQPDETLCIDIYYVVNGTPILIARCIVIIGSGAAAS